MILFIFLERREGRERNINVWLLCALLTRDRVCYPGMLPDWELNWWPFGLHAGHSVCWATSARAKEVFISCKLGFKRKAGTKWESTFFS